MPLLQVALYPAFYTNVDIADEVLNEAQLKKRGTPETLLGMPRL